MQNLFCDLRIGNFKQELYLFKILIINGIEMPEWFIDCNNLLLYLQPS